MTPRNVSRFLLLSILLWLVPVAGWAAVVPDADRLPRDAGAPALPGGHHDLSKKTKTNHLSSPNPLALPRTSNTPGGGAVAGVGSKPGSGASPSSTMAGPSNPLFPAPDAKKQAEANSPALDTPPPSLMIMGGLVVLFICWAGWKVRQGDQEN